MRKLVLWDVMTLDGFFEGRSKWDLDFHMTVWGDELEAFSLQQGEEIGVLLFGRVTHNGMADYWSKETGAVAEMMNRLPKVVASRSGEVTPWVNSRRIEGDVVEAVRTLKAEAGKDIFVFGSADLTADLLAADLVDELRVCIAPVILGAGDPLFKPSDRRINMTLLEARSVKTGGVVLRYALPSA